MEKEEDQPTKDEEDSKEDAEKKKKEDKFDVNNIDFTDAGPKWSGM